jgi:bifunctional non-homologous end joining protein LigD
MRKSPFDPAFPPAARFRAGKIGSTRLSTTDGYRLIIQRDGKRVRLWTRNGHDWSAIASR